MPIFTSEKNIYIFIFVVHSSFLLNYGFYPYLAPHLYCLSTISSQFENDVNIYNPPIIQKCIYQFGNNDSMRLYTFYTVARLLLFDFANTCKVDTAKIKNCFQC